MTQGWFDEDAGPVVRPYAMTRGRTRVAGGERLDLIALVTALIGGGQELPADATLPGGQGLAPEHGEILYRCRRVSESVAELATGLDLPVGVVRVLISDLLEAGLVRVSHPIPAAQLPDENILREVIDGLRAL
ncbi:DUF742 domain-containing protein [Streptomyces spiramenti]|uniref:DUF742 domain-containing protein n=1 Tax=Streptomyces spiramenti TaxID=2720606 RepID=A0ABX1AMC5_9ACTN|nr:DUF742 domain-containing protein [Streptomyces spiramenti]NJP68257.1 DUF742 domain-containing protein [Streptomyces spiramenti]